MEALDGHPLYKWDQILLLKELFQHLDSGGTGRIGVRELEGLVDDSVSLELLRFTMFYQWIKRKQWNRFRDIARGSRAVVTLLDLVQEARVLANESHVKVSNIRTEDEHKAFVTDLHILGAGLGAPGNRGCGYERFHASQSRDTCISRLSRSFNLRRVLSQGDCVWGRLGGLGVWFPAVIDCMHSDGTYDLNYPLGSTALQQARVLSTSRQLLHLTVPPRGVDIIAPKPFRTDQEVLNFLFDAIASEVEKSCEGSGYDSTAVDAVAFRHHICRPKYRLVVSSSLSLSSLLYGGLRCGLSAADSLLHVMNECCCFNGCIDKTKFIDFCLCLSDFCEMNQWEGEFSNRIDS